MKWPFKKRGATKCHIMPGITCNGDCKNCQIYLDFNAPYKQKPSGKSRGECEECGVQWRKYWLDKEEPMGYNTPIPQYILEAFNGTRD